MPLRLLFSSALLAVVLSVAPAFAQTVPLNPQDKVSLQFPNGQIGDIANYYELLTGKTLIRDNQAAASGQQITIVAPDDIPRDQAIAMIKSALILNGFAIVDVDDKTAKLLSVMQKNPKSESIPLYTDSAALPDTEEYVSFFMPLTYVKADAAKQLFLSYITPHPGVGNIDVVPNINAIVVTENVPTVRRVIALKDLIDVEGQRTTTEYFNLERADAEKVAEVLQKLFEPNQQSVTTGATAPQPQQPQNPSGVPVPEGQAPQAVQSGGMLVAAQPASVKVFADKRTNRVMVVAPEDQMDYIRSVVANLDTQVEFEEPLRMPLRFVKAADVLPVLAKLLNENTDANSTDPSADLANQQNQGRNSQIGDDQGNNYSGSQFGNSGSSGSGSGQATLHAEEVDVKPKSVIVGNARIIADTSLNSIIVFGPPDARAKTEKVLNLLDQRPKQVYLACIIGQLTLGDDLDVGLDYLLKFGDVKVLGQGETGTINNLIQSRNASVDIVPGTDTVVDTAANVAQTALPVLSGLTVFGAIGNTVDFYAHLLASTNKFQIISRPMVFTANGQVARISSGQQIPYAGSSLSNINSTTNNANDIGTTVTSTTEFKNVVLELAVQPLINSNKEVTLNISQVNDNVAGTSQVSAGTTAPTVNTQKLETYVTVPNRTTVIIGGLISEDETRKQTGIPFLKDIPGIGYIFSNTSKQKTRRELIVMIQPFIIDSDAALAEANYIERSNTSFKEGLFDKPVPVRPAELPTAEDLAVPAN